ncbi:MAG: hypothetical protein FJX33_11815 [Alphaproteobacteria bacterium]|nr:hypothetical protein [Alphaproteobacteria bacterium]
MGTFFDNRAVYFAQQQQHKGRSQQQRHDTKDETVKPVPNGYHYTKNAMPMRWRRFVVHGVFRKSRIALI